MSVAVIHYPSPAVTSVSLTLLLVVLVGEEGEERKKFSSMTYDPLVDAADHDD